MADHKKIIIHFFLVLLLMLSSVLSEEEEPKDLEEAEANGKLEIIKQIKKINDDGSYTIGYEADDGSFKIESRDVLGNIKGTYGYIDEHGEIKRVSYSSTNNTTNEQQPSEQTPVQEEEKSVVQRIPKILKSNITSSTTRRPIIVYPNLSTPGTPTSSTTSGIQSIPRRRIQIVSSTTTSTTTPRPSILSTVAPARILIQSRPLLRNTEISKSNDSPQIVRPDTVQIHKGTTTTVSPTLINRLTIVKNTLLDAETSSAKPITEQPEIKSNLLRRQLNPDKYPFDPRQHVINLQQAVGHDHVDVYSGSVTASNARPLFTTTARPRILSSTIASTVRPTSKFATLNRLRERAQLLQETTTPEATVDIPKYTTPSPVVPVVQIPANSKSEAPNANGNGEFVPVRHPFHHGTIFVPLQHFQQARPDEVPLPIQQQPREFLPTKEQYLREIQPSASPIPPVYIRRAIPRPMPVQVDANGYIREVVPAHGQYQEQLQDEIDRIKPPVSTRDFQKLLEQLIIRQNRLEQISTITRQTPQLFRPRVPTAYPIQQPQYIEMHPSQQQHGPVQFVQAVHEGTGSTMVRDRPTYVSVGPSSTTTQQPIVLRRPEMVYQNAPVAYHDENAYQNYESQKIYQSQRVPYQPMEQYHYAQQPQPSYVPSKRMATYQIDSTKENEEFLPVDVREMLLLRMLQLAINPALPLDEQETNIVTRSTNEQEGSTPEKMQKVRNVEILGEEEDKKREKRYLQL